MKKVKRWKYYCDYCKKSGGNKYYIEKHEKGCTKNPNRVCGFCGNSGNISELLKIISDNLHYHCFTDDWDYETWTVDNEEEVIKLLRTETENCPACILAAIRQCPVPANLFVSFNFKEEKDAWWADHNEEADYEYYRG